MPLDHLQRLTSRHRTRSSNRQLGALLAFVAGAVNAGGFLAVQRYTSHMTGIISGIADDLAIGELRLALSALATLLSFVVGAACTTLLINWARRRQLQGKYALPLLVEALLLLGFGLVGAHLRGLPQLLVPTAVLLLCFIMGLQNAMVTKISQAEIRTTHMTGVVTDIGIELGRLLYWNRSRERNAVHRVQANRDRLGIHLLILSLFFVGGLAGALAFKHLGFSATLPFAFALILVASPPLWQDLRAARRHRTAPASPAAHE